jgi:rhodanese-related sulfurtransferase
MPGFSEIPPETVHRWVSDGEALLVDVREAEELAQARFKDALHVPMSAFDPGRIPTDSGKKVIFVCAQGLRSAQMGQYMVAEGLLAEAYNLSGGLNAWAEAGLPFEAGGSPPPAG